MAAQPVPDQIRTVFGMSAGDFVPEDGFASRWRCGEVVCSRVDDATLATASARAREQLDLAGMTVARPLRGSDGRYVVGGWRADRYPVAAAEVRPDEILALAGELPEQLGAPTPGRARRTSGNWRPDEVFDRARTAAWEGNPGRDLDAGLEAAMGSGAGGSGFQGHRAEALVVAAGMTRLRDQVRVHGGPIASAGGQLAHLDILRSLRFAPSGPVLTDVLLIAAPPVVGQAIAAVDLLAAGAAGEDLLWRWDHLPAWTEHLACAAAYRLGVHALHPGTAPESYTGLRSAASVVERFVRSSHGF